MEEVHHIRTQKSYCPNIPDTHSDQKIGKSDIDLNKIYTSINEVEVNHQNGESQITARLSNVNSILMAEPHHESGYSNRSTNKSFASKEEVQANHQAGAIGSTSGINSILTEESHQGETQTNSTNIQRGQQEEEPSSQRAIQMRISHLEKLLTTVIQMKGL